MSSEEIVPLALLDGYQVRWSRETVARDIVQNFFDEVEDFRQVTIAVDEEAGAIEVRGPSVFDFEYLRYLGGTSKQAPGRRSFDGAAGKVGAGDTLTGRGAAQPGPTAASARPAITQSLSEVPVRLLMRARS